MQKYFLAAVCAILSLSAGAAAPRIATVNIEQTFKSYYKTAQVEGVIKQQAQVFRDYIARENEKLVELEKKFNLARDRAQNIALSADDQNKAQDEMSEIGKQIRAKRADMEAYAVDRNKYMVKFESDKRGEIMKEISAVVRSEAEKNNYSLVLDSSGRTFNEIPTVVYANAALDITSAVITSLNKGQPPKSAVQK